AAGSWLHVLKRKCWGRKRGPKAENRHGWSAERRGVPIARDAGAPRKRPGSRAVFRGPPVPRKHRAPVGAPPPLGFGGWRKFKDPGAMRRGNELCCVLGCLTS